MIQGDSFGKVFIVHKGNTSGKTETIQLKSACFSNMDLKWYDLSGDIHSKLENYTNSSFSLGFTFQNENNMGELESFQGRFKLPLNLGEIFEPDVKCLERIVQMEMECAKKINLVTPSGLKDSENPVIKGIERSQCGALFVFMTPGKEIVKENSDFFINLALMLRYDDLLDDNQTNVSKTLHKIPFKKLHRVYSRVTAPYKDQNSGFISDEVSSKGDLVAIFESLNERPPVGAMFELNRYYNSLIKLNKKIYEEALKFGTSEECRPLFKSIMEPMGAMMLEKSREWNEKAKGVLGSVQVEICRTTVSTKMVNEAIAMVRGVKLRTEIRESFLFKAFLNETLSHAAKVNDLMSYQREMKEEEDSNNEVYILHWEQGWELGKAFEKVLNEANESVGKINEMGRVLLEIYEGDESLKEYLKIAKEVICGHLQWCAYTKRYHSDLVYDCYVMEE